MPTNVAADTEEAHALAGLTSEERAILAEHDPEAPDTAPAAPEAPEPLVEFRQEIVAPLRSEAPQNANELLAQLGGREHEIERQFEDGDITAKEFREGLRKIGDEREELRWSQRKAELSREMTEQAESDAWAGAVQTFMSTTGKAIADKGEASMIAFDSYVKKVTGDPANVRLSDRAQLDKAHKLFLADFGPAFGGPSRAAQEHALDMARAQAGEPAFADTGRFASLDRLADTDPAAYERAVARMSPEEFEAYSR